MLCVGGGQHGAGGGGKGGAGGALQHQQQHQSHSRWVLIALPPCAIHTLFLSFLKITVCIIMLCRIRIILPDSHRHPGSVVDPDPGSGSVLDPYSIGPLDPDPDP